jgi:hypothetical protein
MFPMLRLIRIQIFIVVFVLCFQALEAAPLETPVQIISPANGQMLDTFLSTVLRWKYPQRPQAVAPFPFLNMNLQVADNPEFKTPIVDANMADNQNSYAVVLVPDTKYYWRLIPMETSGGMNKYFSNLKAEASFTTGGIKNYFNAPDSVRYAGTHRGSHFQYTDAVESLPDPPLSPWYDVKAYTGGPPPAFAEIKDRFPLPVWDGHPEALDAYWYCWQTLMKVWVFAPHAADHEAVANLLGYPNWGPWGSTMVFDSCFILHFSRYGAQAYPYITCLDNCYARQHENGFICRESDRENREVYATFPVNPPLFAWAEWEWYRVTGDKERLRRVLTPIVKHYEWWMAYERRENGLYWVNGVNEADDSPRNSIMYYSASASSYQALAALYLSKIAGEVGRPDLKTFFDAQHTELANTVNTKLWDEKHGVYNDLTRDGQLITELQPGVLCKHAHMFWPLMADIVPQDRIARVVNEIENPASFNRSSGIASLSADSAGYNAATGQYWRGAVWPSAQSMVQEGLKVAGQWDVLQTLGEKYYNACLTAYGAQKTIHENLSPDQPVGYGAPDFVGWGGVGPVANLIEYVLGFDLDAPAHTITWRIRRAERHGLQNLMFDGFKVEMICDARKDSSAPCHVMVTSGGEFTLRIVEGGKTTEEKIRAGTQDFSL